jgi:hypothetical protein
VIVGAEHVSFSAVLTLAHGGCRTVALLTELPVIAGNLLHGAETAGVCALDGRHVARSVARWLERGDWPEPAVPLQAEPPVQ